MQVIFEHSRPGRGATDQWPALVPEATDIPAALKRKTAPLLPEVSELETVRHFTRLSQLNFSIDTHFYPLGSCTMKYNPKACNQYAMLPELLSRHPLAPESHSQGFLTCMYELQEMLKEVTGMQAVSLTPMAGAHGEFAGVAMIRAYHRARGDLARTEIIVPEAAHGTNPATATMCGCTVKEIPVNADGDVDLEALKAAVSPKTAGIMLTNPSTLGVFERRIEEVARIVHAAGGLLYYDGANLNAILGKVRPAFTAPCFHESVVLLDRPVAPVLKALESREILGGFNLQEHYPELGNALLVCATETKTSADIESYANALAETLKAAKAA